MKSRKSRFALPESIGAEGLKARLVTRRSMVDVQVSGDFLILRKSFSPKKPREWSVFLANAGDMRREMHRFDWEEDGDGVHFAFTIKSGSDVMTAADALTAFELYFVGDLTHEGWK